MSRIGNAPLTVPSGVQVSFTDATVTVKGPKGELVQHIDECVTLDIKEGEVICNRVSDSKPHRAKHGLYRSLISNMITGVTEGYKTEQELVGVGYRAQASGSKLELNLGYSHNIVMSLPSEVKVTVESVKGKPPTVVLESIDKQLIGQVAAKIRSLRKPEPYKGKGIRFKGEHIRRKAGKAASK